MSRALDFQIRYGNADELDNYDPVGDVYDNQQFIGGTQYLVFSRPSFDTTSQQTILSDEIGTIGTGRDRSSNFVLRADSSASTFRFVGTSPFDSVKVWEYNGASWSYIDATTSGSYITLTSGYYYKGLDRIVDNQVADRTSFEDYDTILPIYISTRGDGIEVTGCSVVETLNAPWDAVLNDHKGYRKGRMFTGDPNERIEYSTAIPALRNNGDYLELAFKSHSNLENDTYCISSENFRYIQISALIRLSAGGFTDRFNFQVGSADEFYSIKKIRFDRISNVNVTCTISYDNGAVDVKPASLQGNPDLDANPFDVKWLGEWNGREWKGVIEYLNVNGTVYNDDNDFGGTATTTNIARIPYSIADNTVSALGSSELSYTGKYKFNAYRINNDAAYFDTDSYLTPVSGTISGYSITESYGTATFTMSGNNIACTASGSCNGIKLDNGNWYTFNEGIFGDASSYVYDVSGSGIHLQISGQTAAQTWQQVAGQTDLGYDWRNLYGGHRYRLVDAADDIFIPHVVNTQDVPTESLLPSGYTLLTDITAGKYVYNNSTWLLASGQVSEYRSELDAHEMNVTPFTESYGHYIRNQSTRWDRIVIYPNNLSEAANTLVDFNAGDIESIVGITYKVTDIHDLNQINASYSKKFRLPATQRNNDLFDYVYDPNSSDFESLKEPKDCEIISNGIEILRGKGQVEATYKKDIARAYDMSVIGDNYNVYTALDDIMVSGLDLGTFTLSQANVEASWNYTAASGNVVFAPIDWGNKNFNSFDIADITPSLFIRNILQKGFASAGIGYESAWLDGDYAGRLVTPFNGFWTLSDADYATISGYAYFNAEDASYAVTASGVGNKAYLEITEVTSNPNYAPATGYLAADAAKMKFTLAFDNLTYDNANIQALAAGTVGAALFGCTFGIEINGQDVIEKTIGAESLSISTSNIQIIGGDIVRVYMKGAEDVNLTNVSFKSEVKRDIAQDITITLNQYTPVYKDGLSVFDIFKGLADVFNIIAYYDPYSKLLKFEPYADFYSGELDWSDKWNQTLEAKNFYLGNQLNREILHKYKDDDTDYWLERFDKGNEEREPYASYLLELPRNYTKGRRVVENHIFAPTVDYEFSQFGVTIPNIRWNTKDGSQFSGGRSGQIPQPRILYFEGKNNSGTFKMNVGSGFQYSVQEYAYFPRLAFRARSGESWQSLAMDTYDSKNGAFRTYFEPKYRNIWSGITSIYWLNLTEQDIALRPLDKKIYLDGAWWLINQIIDFNPLNDDPTQVELIKLINYTFNIPANKTPWIDIVTGKKFDPVSHKPNNDLPSNGGFDVTTTSGYVISPVDDDYYGVSFGQNNLAPNKANSVMFGSDLNTYWSDQFIVGQFNSPNQNAIFQVGGGTSASGRKNAFEVEKSGGEFVAKVGGDRIISDAWHMTTSGVKRSSYKQLTGSGTLAGDGTLTIYPTHDATSSGTALFNEITFASAMVTNLNGGGGNADLHFNTLTTTQIDIYATSSHAYDIIYKIEGN